jgi:hypothetical protein
MKNFKLNELPLPKLLIILFIFSFIISIMNIFYILIRSINLKLSDWSDFSFTCFIGFSLMS